MFSLLGALRLDKGLNRTTRDWLPGAPGAGAGTLGLFTQRGVSACTSRAHPPRQVRGDGMWRCHRVLGGLVHVGPHPGGSATHCWVCGPCPGRRP